MGGLLGQDGQRFEAIAGLQHLESQPEQNPAQNSTHGARIIDDQHFIRHGGSETPLAHSIPERPSEHRSIALESAGAL
jgi:hypothetical protein